MDNGIKGETAGTTLRAALLRLSDPTEKASETMAELGITVTDASGKLLPFGDIIGQMGEKTKGMANAQKASALATIFGMEAVSGMLAVIEAGPEKLQKLTEGLVNSEGASKKAADAMKDNLKGALEQLSGEFETLQINVGNILIPMLMKAAKQIQKIGGWFNGLSPTMQKIIVITALVTGGFSALIAVLGLLLAMLGSAATGVSAIIRLLPLLRVGLLAVSGPVGIVVGVITALVGIGVALYKNWDTIKEKTGPFGDQLRSLVKPIDAVIKAFKFLATAHEPAIKANLDFGNKVSKSTQKAVQAYVELDSKATFALNQFALSNTVITQEMSTKIIGMYKDMGEQILTQMKDDHEKQLKEATNLFNKTNILTVEEEAKRIQKLKEMQAQEQQNVLNGTQKIEQIIENSVQEKRRLTKYEESVISQIREEMKTKAIKVMSESEVEQKAILERLKTESSKLTAEQAAEVVKNSVKQHEKVVKEAEKEYDEKVKTAIRMRDELGIISAEEAAAMIASAEKEKEETTRISSEMKEQIVATAKEQAEEHLAEIDWETGEGLSKWRMFFDELGTLWEGLGGIFDEVFEILKKDLALDWSEIGTSFIDGANSAVEHASKIFGRLGEIIGGSLSSAATWVSEKIENIRSSIVGTGGKIASGASTVFGKVKKSITEPIDKAKKSVGEAVEKIKGFFTGLKLKIPKPSMPKLPKFSLKTSSKTIMGKTVTYPTGFGVKWAARGGIFDDPTILGVGEAGAEAVVPLVGKRMDPFADAVYDRIEKSLKKERTAMQGGTVINNYWSVNADDINDVQKLVSMLNGLVQTVRSR